MATARKGITRYCFDVTEAQATVIEALFERFQKRAQQAAGVPVTLSKRAFFHALLQQAAQSAGLDWPDDYPSPGGWRGGAKKK